MHILTIALFVMTSGLTVSGIVANIYRLLVPRSAQGMGRATYVAVMTIAGPSVLLDNAARARRKKECSVLAFWLAAAISGYWSLLLGTLVIGVALAL